jgi:type III secretion protein D
VAVHGHLGDPSALAKVVQSRAMREITGLERVSVVNLDQPAAPSAGNGDSTWVVRVIPSKDPYVIAADGSRYYVGATLPRGGRLAGVQDGEMLVDRDGRVEHVKLSGSPPGS